MDDWKILNIVLSWVKEDIEYKRIIGANNHTYVYTWIDADYTVHSNTRSQNVGAVSMGHEGLHKKLSVQRLNTKISTDAELVGVSEYLPYNLWLIFSCMGRYME